MSEYPFVLLGPKNTPAGFGLGQDGELLMVISPCCLKPMEYSPRKPLPLVATPGAPAGRATVTCPCGESYRGYSNPTCLLNGDPEGIAQNWLGPWFGLLDATIEIT